MSSHTSLLARRKNKFSVSNLHQPLNDSQTKAKENPFGTEEVTLQVRGERMGLRNCCKAGEFRIVHASHRQARAC